MARSTKYHKLLGVYIYNIVITTIVMFTNFDIQAAPPCRVNSTCGELPQEARRLRSELWEERSAAASAAVVAAGESCGDAIRLGRKKKYTLY